jgi:ribonucleotide reductase beta subunit family protein with ferritin-like domain
MQCRSAFAFEVIETVRREESHLFDADWRAQVRKMIIEAVEREAQLAEDLLSGLAAYQVGVQGEVCFDATF